MNYTNLSKEISYALRHAPWKYELELDEEGYVPIDQLLCAINENAAYDRSVTKKDLEYIIESSDKRRHEISGDKIRALYGHSVPLPIKKNAQLPPAVLYHGTAHRFLAKIEKSGLLPMQRQYVHLSVDIDTAEAVGRRRDNSPVILKIDTVKAVQSGIEFYVGNDKVWLAKHIPPKFISVSD